jgi:hypothetical protein
MPNVEDKLRVMTKDISFGGGINNALSNGRGGIIAKERCVLEEKI